MSAKWICVRRRQDECRRYLDQFKVFDHPLKQSTITVLECRGTRTKVSMIATGAAAGAAAANSNNSLNPMVAAAATTTLSLDPLSLAFDGSDPLSQFAKQQETSLGKDPLSRMVAEMDDLTVTPSSTPDPTANGKPPKEPANLLEMDLIEPWAARRGAILNKYTTSEKLSIVTSFLTGGESIKPQTTMSEKVKYRLEQLDDFDEGSVRQMLDLSQQEYVVKIEQLNHELVQAWNQDQRVKALKIAIQCSKLLSDTSVIQFYPSKFVLITDILDIFGRLVYERLRTKAEYVRPGSREATSLPENFTPEMVPETAKETCQNWFYKIASIRELLPRLYVEIAILKCYSFLARDEFSEALRRLTKMIRGIGDPLVAIYARCYLCRVGMGLTLDRTYIRENLDDVLVVYHTIFNGGIRSEIARHRITLNVYISLYLPALDWILQGVTILTTDSQLDEILQRCTEKKNPALLLQSAMQSFRSDFIAGRACQLVQIIASTSEEGLSRAQLLRLLGSILSHTPPPTEQRAAVLTNAWKTISTMGCVEDYIQCAEMWAQYTSQHFGLREIDSFMGDILQHMTPNRAYEQHYHELQVIVDKIVSNTQDIHGVMALDNFLPLLDLFQKESIKLEVCKNILTSYRNASASDTAIINDPVVTNALMHIGRVLNDSVNALTGEDERRQISGLICHFVRKVDFGRDFEQQLAFYVEARSVLSNLDSALSTLIHSVNRLATSTRRIVRGQHTQKTGAFVKACVAYCFITIPSIIDVRTRMELYLQSGQVALLNVCLQQADSCFEAALNLIPEVPRMVEIDGKLQSTEGFLKTYVVNFLSTLVIVPDNPTQGVLYLLRLLLDVVPRYPFEPNSNTLSSIYLHVLDFLSVAAQEVYPYHIVNVISNDELYGSDPKFIAEVNELCCTVCDKLLNLLKELLDANAHRAQSQLALDLFLKIITGADLTVDKMFTLTYNLWNLAVKNRNVLDAKQLQSVLSYTEHLAEVTQIQTQHHCLVALLEKMKSRL
ncbi:esophageal cancer associated protein [Anopheles darlingi]|uniref:Esophageal cancer associated protein n=1 Tax=Anopheles darlingi TaxID=43151 RepID=W5JA04_ANODA|nr:esophageal cancer associated protein [Anopheles darlingi]